MTEFCKRCKPNIQFETPEELIAHLEGLHGYNISKEAKFAR